jgi:hypothetical protein
MDSAIDQLKENYGKFASEYNLVQIVDLPVLSAIQQSETIPDVREAAQVFETQIAGVIRALVEQRQISDAKWTGIVSNFMAKLYPLARLALDITSIASQVSALRILQDTDLARRPAWLH